MILLLLLLRRGSGEGIVHLFSLVSSDRTHESISKLHQSETY